MIKIILASESPRRKQLLQELDLEFKIQPSSIEEEFSFEENVKKVVARLAQAKAEDIGAQHRGEDVVIIAADTLVEYEGEIIGKLGNKKEATRILQSLSGSMHSVYTGLTLYNPKTQNSDSEVKRTKIYFRKLGKKEIKDYVNSGEPFGKAGGYAIQEKAAKFVEKIEGDFYSAVGLPLCSLSQKLTKFGIKI